MKLNDIKYGIPLKCVLSGILFQLMLWLLSLLQIISDYSLFVLLQSVFVVIFWSWLVHYCLQEVFLPLYTLGILIVIKIIIPNPNFPVMSTPRGEAVLFEHFQQFKNHTIAIVPNTTQTQVSISHLSIIVHVLTRLLHEC
jgi:hypothetical protein